MKKTSHLLWKLLLVAGVLVVLALVYLDALVSTTFEGRKWEIPARVYARPLELFPGKRLGAGELEHELSLLGYRAVNKVAAAGQTVMVSLTQDGSARETWRAEASANIVEVDGAKLIGFDPA